MSYQKDSDGVRVVLSAPQLAAVLTRRSISQTEMLSNRLWGGLQLVGGLLEMVGAAALCVMPEPTMASKAGCIVFGAHGSDSAAAGLRQVWTGRDTATLTQQGTTKLAEAMKADPDMANNIGLSLDMVVPFGFAGSMKAARVASVSMGRINLMRHEAKDGSGIGGHTIRKHVGINRAWLQARLAREPRREMVSSFPNLETAERAISQVMQQNVATIRVWAQASNGSKRLSLIGETGHTVGYGLVRETGQMIELSKVQMFLRKEQYNDMPFYIITAYLIK
ncbi:RNase A-like domain-containing protein [Paraburkholderia sp. HP33-1]|uniref:RNase A-like domain-containing protein n=1 Tax=Paraburkholderia sp. HP33-1 TaxID=2883243 RepID=UPI001F306FBD|nr:RNase A-like domain-containing protein [Paraburkholderia sp. HP33-1]